MAAPTLQRRGSGILLHPTSLPGPYGSGDLGDGARAFVEFLSMAEQTWWQMLPVAPPGYGSSPYSAQSAFAGNPMLLDLRALADDGLLRAEDLAVRLPSGQVDFARVWALREARLRTAFAAHERDPKRAATLDAFAAENASWLADFTLFRALKRAHGEIAWASWPKEYRDRDEASLARARRELRDEVRFEAFLQREFDRAWRRLKSDCAARGIGLIGDLPIFVAHDSADVWSQRELFHLDPEGQPTVIAGVPPDYFSATGQRWGNPLYRWPRLRDTGYAWWIARLRASLARFDVVRLDHFIGFSRYWEIPASCETAIEGRWVKGPGADFFRTVERELGRLPLIAEDLGVVTPKVKALRDQFRLPGIKVLQFAFGNDPCAPDFLPHNYARRGVVYTGTHDNETTVGWFRDRGGGESTRSSEQAETERARVCAYLASDGREIHWDMIRAAMMSVARTAIFPVQDLLGLGNDARMNRPGQADGNWSFRLADGALTPAIAGRLGSLTKTYGRGRA